MAKFLGNEVDIYVTMMGSGPRGEPGKDGDTPVKGVDYFTEADKAEIVASVLAEIPVVGSEEY